MKSLFLCMLFALAGMAVSAQFIKKRQPVIPQKKWETQKFGLQTLSGSAVTDTASPDPDRQKLLKKLIHERSPQATLSHTTKQGRVYILPPDRMGCLVPDMKKVTPMPGIRPVPTDRMPNAIPKRKLRVNPQ